MYCSLYTYIVYIFRNDVPVPWLIYHSRMASFSGNNVVYWPKGSRLDFWLCRWIFLQWILIQLSPDWVLMSFVSPVLFVRRPMHFANRRLIVRMFLRLQNKFFRYRALACKFLMKVELKPEQKFYYNLVNNWLDFSFLKTGTRISQTPWINFLCQSFHPIP